MYQKTMQLELRKQKKELNYSLDSMARRDLQRSPRSYVNQFKTPIRRQLPDEDNIDELLQLHE